MEEYQVQSGNLGISGNGKALDYKAIFGALSSCSIPFLDLPSVDNDLEFRHCSVSDYSDIFRGTDDRNFAASLEELLALRDSSEIITRFDLYMLMLKFAFYRNWIFRSFIQARFVLET